RCFKWLAIGKGKVLGSTQDKGFLTEKMAYGNIRRQPHPLDTVIEVDMIAPPELREHLRPVCTYRLADDAHAWPTRQRLYFPNKHQRLKVTLILSEPRGKIGNPIYAFRSRYLRTEHIRVLDIVLFASKLPNRLYGK